MQQKVEAPKQAVVMSFGSITNALLERIEGRYGVVGRYNAAALRTMRIFDAVRTLIGISTPKLIIAIETEGGRPLAVPLSVAAAFTRARSIDIVWPDFTVQSISRFSVLGTCVKAVWQTLSARRSLHRWLRCAKRKPTVFHAPTKHAGGGVLYLDANISLGAPHGGWVGHTAGVVDALVARGYDVTYASAKTCPTDAARMFHLQPPAMLSFPAELNYYPYADRIDEVVGRYLREKPEAFIYQRFSMHNCSGAMLKRRTGIPYVVEYNGSEIWTAQNWGASLSFPEQAAVMQHAALDEADLVVTVSEGLAADCIAQGISPDRIVVYPNGVRSDIFDPDRFTAKDVNTLRNELGVQPSARVVGFLGTFGQWHGVDFLAECIVRLIREDADWLSNQRIHFLLIGHGLLMPRVMEILEGVPDFRKHVTLAGLVPSALAPNYLALCDILVSPHVPNPDNSEFFGSPTKLFEYMAMRKPILGADLGQIGAVLSGRGVGYPGPPERDVEPCGLLYKAGDSSAFIEGLKALVDDPALAARLASAAWQEVLRRYTWNHHGGPKAIAPAALVTIYRFG
ncbi:MAG: glycosyltransferase [Rhizobiales bacterium]|nr:glycosyltransferase [Hyphomicrobiales bacterium]